MPSFPSKTASKKIRRVLKYCTLTPRRGLFLRPKGNWDGTEKFLFEISGSSNSEYAKAKNRRSLNGWLVFLNEAPINYKSKMMPIVVLSVTEAKLFAAVQCMQDMLCAIRILNSMGLKVKLPMIFYLDSKGAK
eukprot:539753-Ditylum_brightwellii.AAC.2